MLFLIFMISWKKKQLQKLQLLHQLQQLIHLRRFVMRLIAGGLVELPVVFFYCWDCDQRYSVVITNSKEPKSENCCKCHKANVVLLRRPKKYFRNSLVIGAVK